jgi:hypothetical protein
MSIGNPIHVDLVIHDPIVKERYLNLLRDVGKVPVCKNCKKLFDLGFPDNEDGASDNLICHENDLICNCEYYKMVKNLYNVKEDGIIDITPYYEVYNGLLRDPSRSIKNSSKK